MDTCPSGHFNLPPSFPTIYTDPRILWFNSFNFTASFLKKNKNNNNPTLPQQNCNKLQKCCCVRSHLLAIVSKCAIFGSVLLQFMTLLRQKTRSPSWTSIQNILLNSQSLTSVSSLWIVMKAACFINIPKDSKIEQAISSSALFQTFMHTYSVYVPYAYISIFTYFLHLQPTSSTGG